MGYRCRWLAVRAGDRAEALSRLRFSIAEELNEEVYDTGLYAVDVPDWFVVMGDGWDFMDLVERTQAARLSDHHEVMFFYTDDTPMCAEATLFLGGQMLWSVTYDGATGTPLVEGVLPDSVGSILAAARAEQKAAGGPEADVDWVYGSVAEIGHSIVGFRHEETLSAGEHLPIYQLEALDPAGLAPTR